MREPPPTRRRTGPARPPERPWPAEVQSRLTTACLGRSLIWLPAVDSTNRRLAEEADAGAPEGLVVAADGQTAGRGRLDHTWWSPPGFTLAVSILLRPAVPLDQVASLALLLGLAVRRTLQALPAGLAPQLKWPNDVWLNGRKVGGILCDMRTESGRIRHVTAGIGVNVNGARQDFPPDLRDTATSLQRATGNPWNRAALLAALLNTLEPVYRIWEREGLAPFLAEWRAADLLLGRDLVIEQGARRLVGRADGIEPGGALRLKQDNGEIQIVHAGDAHLRSGAESGRKARS